MTCAQLIELVEPIAAGEVTVGAEMRAHLESCPGCAAALAVARRIEAVLASREAPPAPERFAAAVFQRIRREGWRAEQQVDRLFNVAIVVSALLVAGGVLALLNLGPVMAASAAFIGLVTAWVSRAAIDAAPAIGTYVSAAGLLVSALVMWWWAERRFTI